MKAEKIDLFSMKSPPMRAFHVTWMAFFVCFFAWFAVAPLMPVIRDELKLSREQVTNSILLSSLFTIIARLGVSYLCDRFGPRLAYASLLVIGALPVFGLALVHSYESFLVMRFFIGGLGASFVLTQYHSSVMFAPRIVGTANATTAGWGNLGGGVTQITMPIVLTGLMALGFSSSSSWRLAMVGVGLMLWAMAYFYYRFTSDLPEGNFRELELGHWSEASKESKKVNTLGIAAKDPRSWILGLQYGACFGIEITIHNMAPLYFLDTFHLGLAEAGMVAGIFGLTNIFARSLGGYVGDLAGRRFGLSGRSQWLGGVLLLEGLALVIFSRMHSLPAAIISLLIFGSLVGMSCGATYAVVPFINKKALASVSGIVGAGGTVGALLSGLLFRIPDFPWADSLMVIGLSVAALSLLSYPIPLGANLLAKVRSRPRAAVRTVDNAI